MHSGKDRAVRTRRQRAWQLRNDTSMSSPESKPLPEPLLPIGSAGALRSETSSSSLVRVGEREQPTTTQCAQGPTDPRKGCCHSGPLDCPCGCSRSQIVTRINPKVPTSKRKEVLVLLSRGNRTRRRGRGRRRAGEGNGAVPNMQTLKRLGAQRVGLTFENGSAPRPTAPRITHA